MYNEETASKIKRMIEKECQRTNLTELCEFYGVSTDDFYSFLYAGMRAAKKEGE